MIIVTPSQRYTSVLPPPLFVTASPCTFPSLLTTVSPSKANPHSWNKSAPFARSFIIVSKWLKSGWSTYGSSVRPCRPQGVSCLPRVMPFILVSVKSTSQRYKFSSPHFQTLCPPFHIPSIAFFCEVKPPCSQFFSLQATFGGWGGGGGGFGYHTRWVLYCDLVYCRVLRFSCLYYFIVRYASTGRET
jgi:hypothetical protein